MHNLWAVFCDYIEAGFHGIPWWVFVLALVVVIVGSIIAFTKKGRDDGVRISARLFLLFYVVVLYCSTVFFRGTMRATTQNWYNPFWHYEFLGQGKVKLLHEVIMNIAVFIPIGFALGLAFRKIKGWQAVLVGMGVSVGIELLQYFFRKGFADVDDVIHNTLGCALGWMVYWMVKRMVGRGTKHKNFTETNLK